MNKFVEYDGCKFRALDDEQEMGGTSKLINYIDTQSVPQVNAENYGGTAAQFRGTLLKLFGPPLASTDLTDEAFYYLIEAIDAVGEVYILTAYEGPSGPAIGAKIFQHEESRSTAKILVQLIRATEPEDFEAKTYYEDTDSIVVYGCKGGKCYYREMNKGSEAN